MRDFYSRAPLLPRLLFCLTAVLALALVSLVLLAPWLDDEGPPEHGRPRLVAVFAHDAAVRRIAIAGAGGLVVTACVFFRRPVRRRKRRPPGPPWHNVVGA